MSIPKIDPYPPAPTPEDDEATFDEKAYEHAASLEPRRVQMNEVATYVNTRAADANSRAVAAAASATASANSAARADEWANKAPGSVVASGKYSARHYSDLSDKFANAPEDVEVEPGKYSALHWQEKAKKIADVHATTVATDPLPTVLATNVQEALRDLAYQSDQLRVAKNQLKYGDGPYPVLDFQFARAKYLDPRIQFTRASVDWDEEGNEYGIDEPVLTDKGIWVSGARTNLYPFSKKPLSWPSLNGEVSEITVGGRVYGEIRNTREGVANYVDLRGPYLNVGDFFSIQFEFLPHLSSYEWLLFQVYVGAESSPISGTVHDDGTLVISRNLQQAKIRAERSVRGWVIKIEGNSKESDVGTVGVRLRTDTGVGYGETLVVGSAQIEIGRVCTPYIPTDGSQVTVSGSFAILPRIDAPMNGLSVVSKCLSLRELDTVTTFIGGTDGRFSPIYWESNQRRLGIDFRNAGGFYGHSNFTPVAGEYFNAATAVDPNNSRRTCYVNGELGFDITGSLVELDQYIQSFDDYTFNLGRRGSSFGLTGYISNVSIYDTYLPPLLLQELTS